MMYRCAAAVALAACGQVSSSRPTGDAGDADAAVPAVAYKGTIPATMPAMFGGAPYCNYTITFKQLELDLGILPSHQASSGRLQALNVEATDASCPNGVIPATIANYTLSSSSAGTTGTALMFTGDAANQPMATLVGTLTLAGSIYTAALTFHRSDIPPPLDWTVQTTVTLSAQ